MPCRRMEVALPLSVWGRVLSTRLETERALYSGRAMERSMLQSSRTRAGRMGALMALLALLFALTPMLEAMACAAEGCDVACSEQADRIQTAEPGDSDPDGCGEGHCICAASHCSHVAIPAPDANTSTVVTGHSRATPLTAPHFVSSTPQTPDRPPRA
jgi:hypothetical protein